MTQLDIKRAEVVGYDYDEDTQTLKVRLRAAAYGGRPVRADITVVGLDRDSFSVDSSEEVKLFLRSQYDFNPVGYRDEGE